MLRNVVSLPARAFRLLRDSLRWDRPFIRNVLVVALPMVIQQLVTASLHIVDGLMVSGLGDAAYSAVTQANRVTFMFNLFSFGTCTGGAIFLSQYWGGRDIRRMRQTMGLTMMFVLIVAAVFMSVSLLMPRQIISLFLPQGESFDRAVEYLSVVAFGYLFTAVDNVYAATLKAAEKTYLPMLCQHRDQYGDQLRPDLRQAGLPGHGGEGRGAGDGHLRRRVHGHEHGLFLWHASACGRQAF